MCNYFKYELLIENKKLVFQNQTNLFFNNNSSELTIRDSPINFEQNQHIYTSCKAHLVP